MKEAGGDDKTYGLFAHTGGRRFAWRLHDPGIALGHGRIAWREDGARHEAKLADILSVHLQSGGDWQNAIGQCDIGLHDGRVLHVSDATASGVPDQARRAVYRDFLRDLHGRLERGRVSFTAGYSQARYCVVLIAAILLGLIIVAVPLALLLITGETRALLLLFVGLMLALPLARMAKANAPRPYTPEELME